MPAASNTSGATTAARERRSILRRWPKAVRTRWNRGCGATSTAGVGRRRISARADSTFGRGTNTLAGTSPAMRAVAQYDTFTVTAP